MSSHEPGEIEIRQAVERDARLIASLGTVTFYEAYFEQDDPHALADYLVEYFSPGKIAVEMAEPESVFFIVFRRGRAVGYAKLRGGLPHESIRAANSIELHRLYLVERVWGSGIGDLLLEHCLQFARELEKDVLWLGVWEQNPRAVNFYAKHGFTRVGSLEFPYGDSVGINAVMQIDLNQNI